ncbi:MAG TPA: CHASE3 domain-containing protein, partial [Steroidobacteraceae bacterium]|nr:CHASE3 domain-containing protein [Steroidobacteraceae bacterium]
MSSVMRQMVVVALLLATVVALFVAAQVGQRRLEDASARIELSARRQQAVAALTQLVREAESGERGYILVGNAAYLEPFQRASERFAFTVQRLDAAFSQAGSLMRGNVAELKRLSNTKFEEMRRAIDLFRTRGRAAALEVVRTVEGPTTMAEIDGVADRLVELESGEALDASHSWQVSRWASFATTSVALVASAGLLLLLTRLLLRQWRFKELETEQLTVRQGELEQLVEQRTAELSELSTHLQSLAEQEKAALARELHDELGGLLVAARMDLSWV